MNLHRSIKNLAHVKIGKIRGTTLNYYTLTIHFEGGGTVALDINKHDLFDLVEAAIGKQIYYTVDDRGRLDLVEIKTKN